MPRKRTLKLRCPMCKKPVNSTDTDFPFCSDRCRIIDLGKWASGEHVVPSTDSGEAVEEGIRSDSDEES